MNFIPFLQYSDTFIETGTAVGDGVRRAQDAGFTTVHSIEADESLHTIAASRVQANLHLGLSYDILPTIIPDKRCVFFLDAHPAGPGTHGHDELMTGDYNHHQDSIITRELGVILRDRNDHVIIIDDMQGWDSGSKYRNIIRAINPLYKFSIIDDMGHKEKIMICLPRE